MIQTKDELDSLCFAERNAFLNQHQTKGQRILDVGCGDGRFTLQHFADGAAVLGLDTKQEEINVALKSLKESDHSQRDHIRFACADIVDYPLENESLDIAIFLRSF